MSESYTTSAFPVKPTGAAKYYTGVELCLGGDSAVSEYRFLVTLPSKSVLRRDFYQYWKGLPTVSPSSVSREIDSLYQPFDYSDEILEYPGFYCTAQPVLGNAEWFLQDAVKMYNDKAKSMKEPVGYSATEKGITEVDITAPVDFVVVRGDNILRKCIVRCQGEEIFRTSIERADVMGNMLPCILLTFKDDKCLDIEVCNVNNDLIAEGFKIKGCTDIYYNRSTSSIK